MHARAIALIVGGVLACQVAAIAGGHRSYKWWQSEQIRKELGLTATQVETIEGLFQATLPDLRAQKDALDIAQERLSILVTDNDSREGEVARQVDTVERARSQLSKTRTIMLFRIRRVLTPAQRRTLDAIHERSEDKDDHHETDA